MSKWNKVQDMVTEKEGENEEIEEDTPIIEIREIPDPKFRFKILRPLNFFIRKAKFQDGETKAQDEMLPCPTTRNKYIPLQPFHKSQGSHSSFKNHNNLTKLFLSVS